MNLHLVFPKLPPTPDGIGDYTARMAEALTAHAAVKILTAPAASDPIPGVEVVPAFTLTPPARIDGVLAAVAADPPDWLVLQYNPFSYGRWGWNPHLPQAMRVLKRRHPGVRLAVMVHEVAPPLLNARLALMSTWQLAQLAVLGRTADLVFAAIEPWVAAFSRWFGPTPVHHLPVGSNLPYHPVPRAEARRQLGFGDAAFVLGVFGTAHPSRLLGFVRAAAEALRRTAADVRVLYVGPDGAAVRHALGEVPMHDAGRVPAADASRYFAAMDLCLAPFRGGVSTRRGSFMAALQHGVPTVSTQGRHTGALLQRAANQAFLLAADGDRDQFQQFACSLAQDPARRTALGATGQRLYQATFAWDVTAARLANALAHHRPAPAA